jgi:UPF0716 protein FxsA
MRLIFLLVLLAFPLAELLLLIKLFQQYGIWVLLYLVVVGVLGLRLIREEKLLFSGRMMQGILQGASPIKAIFGSARNMIAGVLLMIPGVITDAIAVILLLIPVNRGVGQPSDAPAQPSREAANDNVIEGEFRRED